MMPSQDTVDTLARRVAALEAFLVERGYQLPPDPMQVPAPSAPSPPVPDVAPPFASIPPVAPIAIPIAARAEEPAAPTAEFASSAEKLAAMRRQFSGARPVAQPPPLPKQPSPPTFADAAPITPAMFEAAAATPRYTAAPAPAANMEQAIGLKLAGWIGAIIVVIGAAMGVKFAYDQGWLGGFPDEAKLGLLYAVALSVIGLGEWVYRRVDPRAAVGVYAAGVASLFVVSYAGSAYFELYSLGTAFALMAGSCAIGAVIALRGRFVSIAILSHLGANLAPLILRDANVGETPLLIYLLALQVMAVGLAYVGQGGRWWMLRTLALFTTTLWMIGRLIDQDTAHTQPTILFAFIYAAVFQIELVFAARRADRSEQKFTTFSFATFSLATTGVLIAEILRWSSHLESRYDRGAILLALAAVAAAAGAFGLRSNGVVLRSLATSWLTQAALLVVIAVPVMLDGQAVTLAWAALSVGYAVLGYQLRRMRTLLAGAAVWTVAAVHLLVSVAGEREMRATATTLMGVDLPVYLGLALLLGAAGHLIALIAGSRRFVPEPPEGSTGARQSDLGIGDLAAIAATSVWAFALIAALPPLGATSGLLAVAWVLFGIGKFTSRRIYAAGSIVVVLLALAKWATVDVLGERVMPGTVERAVVFNMTMAVGAAAATSLVAILFITRRSRSAELSDNRSAGLAWLAIVVATLAMTVGLSSEVERAARLAAANGSLVWPTIQAVAFGWTMLWLVAAQVPAIVGRSIDSSPRRCEIARRSASVLTLLLAIKFIVIDCIGFAIGAARVDAMPFVNLQMLTAAAVVAALLWSLRNDRSPPLGTMFRAGLFAVPLLAISIELDRQFGPSRTLVAWSAFWGAYAIGSIVLGFARRAASLRFAGLGLLGITLLKIVIVDLAAAPTGWRILSFLAVGIVLLMTSVLYGKLSPRLLASPAPSPT